MTTLEHSLQQFSDIVGKSFFNNLKDSLVPLDVSGIKEKTSRLNILYNQLSNYKYHPSNPREYIIDEKSAGVARIIPTFTFEDYSVYFYCIKCLETLLTDESVRIKGVFGGWRLGHGISNAENNEIEENELNLYGIFSEPLLSFDSFAWKKNWQEFSRIAYEYSQLGTYRCFLHFDIANFYDNINLNILEQKIRLDVKTENVDYIIQVLFYFLGYWNNVLRVILTKALGYLKMKWVIVQES